MRTTSMAIAILSTVLIAVGWWAAHHPDQFGGSLSSDAASYVAGAGFLLIPIWVLLDRIERRRNADGQRASRGSRP